MAGLLGQLQKRRKKKSPDVSDVLLFSEVEDLDEIEKDLEDNASDSLNGLFIWSGPEEESSAESARQSEENAESDSHVLKVIRRKNKKQSPTPDELDSEDEGPWWLTQSLNPIVEVDALVSSAIDHIDSSELGCRELEQIIIAAEKAVNKAEESLRSQFRFTRKAQSQAENVLVNTLNGMGPLLPLFKDEEITDILMDSHDVIKVIRRGQALETPFAFGSEKEYRLFIDVLLKRGDRELNEHNPIADFCLDDKWKSRINVIDSSLADGKEPRVCIKIPRVRQISFYDVLRTKALPPSLAAWLAEIVSTKGNNILVAGSAGSGKTAMAAALLSAVDSDERIITIEEIPEIYIPTMNLEKLITRPPDKNGRGGVGMVELLKAAVQRSPHRIVIGEITEHVAIEYQRMLEAGHCGSLATIRAETGHDALWQLVDLISACCSAPEKSIVRRLSSAIDLVISMKRIDNKPCLVEILEVNSSDGEAFSICPLMRYVGLREGKRTWQIQTFDSSLIKELSERGVVLAPSKALLPPDEPKARDTERVRG